MKNNRLKIEFIQRFGINLTYLRILYKKADFDAR